MENKEESTPDFNKKTFTTCQGKADSKGICDTCYQPVQSSNINCCRMIEVKSQREDFIKSEIEAGDTNLVLAYRIGLKVGEAKRKFEYESELKNLREEVNTLQQQLKNK